MIERNNSAVLIIDMQEKLVPLVRDHKECVEHCHWVLSVARILNIPIFTTQQYPQKLGATLQSLQTLIDTQHVINKMSFSLMDEPHAAEKINSSGKKQWILMGIETHVCVLQTAYGLQKAGHEVFIVVEATQAREELDKNTAIERLRKAGIHIVTREMVAYEWLRAGGTPEFKKINEEFVKK